jgi:hypothetical protein
MKFAVDTSSLLANYIPTNDVEQARLDLILNGVVDAIVNKWQDALNVRPSDPLNFFDGSLTNPSSGACFGYGSFPEEPVDADHLVFVTGFRANTGPCTAIGESGLIGFASSCSLDSSDGSPKAGTLYSCAK